MTPATSAVIAATCGDAEVVAGCVLAEADDEGVQHDDVAHREEGGEAAAEFCGDGGASLSDLEVTVQCALGFCLGLWGAAVFSEDIRENP